MLFRLAARFFRLPPSLGPQLHRQHGANAARRALQGFLGSRCVRGERLPCMPTKPSPSPPAAAQGAVHLCRGAERPENVALVRSVNRPSRTTRAAAIAPLALPSHPRSRLCAHHTSQRNPSPPRCPASMPDHRPAIKREACAVPDAQGGSAPRCGRRAFHRRGSAARRGTALAPCGARGHVDERHVRNHARRFSTDGAARVVPRRSRNQRRRLGRRVGDEGEGTVAPACNVVAAAASFATGQGDSF
eukprot:350001-Chlamydomonas_euryale.AAC.4